MRVEFPKAVRLAAWRRCCGRCEECDARLYPGRFEYDHSNPAAFLGTATLANCRVLCRPCHRKKTHTSDVPAIAKSNRIRAAWAGIRKDRVIRAWRKFDGTAVYAPRKR